MLYLQLSWDYTTLPNLKLITFVRVTPMKEERRKGRIARRLMNGNDRRVRE